MQYRDRATSEVASTSNDNNHRGGGKMKFKYMATVLAVVILALVTASFATSGAAQASTARANIDRNNLVCSGGVYTKAKLLYYARGGLDPCGRKVAPYWADMGITPEVAQKMHSGTVCSDQGWISAGHEHSPKPSADRWRPAGGGYFVRPLSVWGATCYEAWIGYTADGHEVAVLKSCGNGECKAFPPKHPTPCVCKPTPPPPCKCRKPAPKPKRGAVYKETPGYAKRASFRVDLNFLMKNGSHKTRQVRITNNPGHPGKFGKGSFFTIPVGTVKMTAKEHKAKGWVLVRMYRRGNRWYVVNKHLTPPPTASYVTVSKTVVDGDGRNVTSSWTSQFPQGLDLTILWQGGQFDTATRVDGQDYVLAQKKDQPFAFPAKHQVIACESLTQAGARGLIPVSNLPYDPKLPNNGKGCGAAMAVGGKIVGIHLVNQVAPPGAPKCPSNCGGTTNNCTPPHIVVNGQCVKPPTTSPGTGTGTDGNGNQSPSTQPVQDNPGTDTGPTQGTSTPPGSNTPPTTETTTSTSGGTPSGSTDGSGTPGGTDTTSGGTETGSGTPTGSTTDSGQGGDNSSPTTLPTTGPFG